MFHFLLCLITTIDFLCQKCYSYHILRRILVFFFRDSKMRWRPLIWVATFLFCTPRIWRIEITAPSIIIFLYISFLFIKFLIFSSSSAHPRSPIMRNRLFYSFQTLFDNLCCYFQKISQLYTISHQNNRFLVHPTPLRNVANLVFFVIYLSHSFSSTPRTAEYTKVGCQPTIGTSLIAIYISS